MIFRCLAPLDQAKPWTGAAVEGDLDPGDAERMDAGARVVVAPVRLMLDLDAVGLDLGFQVAALRKRQILEDRPMGVTGNDRGNALVIVVRPLVELPVHLVAQAGIEGGPGRVLGAAPLKIRPKVMNEELADGRAFSAAFRICLVTVNKEHSAADRRTPAIAPSGTLAFAYPGYLRIVPACSACHTLRSRQENPFVNFDPGKERPIDRFVVLPIDVMVAPHL